MRSAKVSAISAQIQTKDQSLFRDCRKLFFFAPRAGTLLSGGAAEALGELKSPLTSARILGLRREEWQAFYEALNWGGSYETRADGAGGWPWGPDETPRVSGHAMHGVLWTRRAWSPSR